ncbi:MAG: phosphatase PAP2 family protein [Nocardioidaceae bacterium]
MTDTHLFERINSFAEVTPWLHGALATYAWWAGLATLAVLLVVAWWRARGLRDSGRAVAVTVLTGAATIVALLVNQHIVSPAIARPRPCQVLANVEVLLPCSNDYSMPSDHTVIAGAFVAGLLVVSWRLGAAALALALLLAFARVYVGVHYPSDTLAGLLLGGLVSATMVLSLGQPTEALVRRLAQTHLRRLVTSREDAWMPPTRQTWKGH